MNILRLNQSNFSKIVINHLIDKNMKKIVIAILALFTFAVNIYAQDKIEISDVQIPEKGSANIVVNLISQERSYLAFQFDIKLPAGISASTSTKNLTERCTSISEGWSVAFKKIDEENNIYNCIAYNSDNKYISGTEGPVLYITLTADETLTEGDTGVGYIQAAIMSTKEVKYPSEDGTFNIKIVEDRVIFNETDTELPVYTAGTGNVRVNRKIKGGQWNTIVLPFNLTKAMGTALFGADASYAQFSGFLVDYGDDEENLTPLGVTIQFNSYTIPARGNLAGGTPVLVKTSADIETIEYDNVTLVDATVDVSKDGEFGKKGAFKGTFVKTVIPEDGLFINSEKFYYSVGKTNIKGFRGWFMLDEIVGKETDFGAKVTFTIDGEATEIDGVPSYQRVVEGVYDLSGRKIKLEDGDLNKLQKGVYIIDGKKVTIK